MTIDLINEVFDNTLFLDAIANLQSQLKIPVTLAYKINDFWKELHQFNVRFQDIKDKLELKYGTKNEKGHTEFSNKQFEEFSKELKELYNIKITCISEKFKAHPDLTMSGDHVKILRKYDIMDFSTLDLT